MLKDVLMDDFKASMREKDELAKSVITMLRSAIKQIEVDTRTELGDAEVIQIISKQVKQKKSAIEEFAKSTRTDLIEQAEREIAFLQKYLPQPLSEQELSDVIQAVISETAASSMKDMGRVVKLVNEKVAGRADSKTVADMVKSLLGN